MRIVTSEELLAEQNGLYFLGASKA